jgi:hypothetical protein
MTSAHAYNTEDLNGDGEISEFEMVMRAREIQGMWLVRAYILLASCGVDKATMYMCEDAADDDVGAIGKYGTCGIWATARTADENRYQIFDATLYNEKGEKVKIDNENGEKVDKIEVYEVKTVSLNDKGEEVTTSEYFRTDNDQKIVAPEGGKISTEYKMEAKDAYYYMYTLYKTLGSMTFVKEIDSGNKDVWIYEFADDNGKVGYAVWCPTSNGTKVEDYKLYVGNTNIRVSQLLAILIFVACLALLIYFAIKPPKGELYRKPATAEATSASGASETADNTANEVASEASENEGKCDNESSEKEEQ